MKRTNCTESHHFLGKFPISLYHHNSIAGLERNDNIVEIGINAHLYPFHCSFCHCKGSVPIKIGYILSQRSMIKPNSYSSPFFLAYFYEFLELQFSLLMIFMEISWIYPDFFDPKSVV